MNPMNKAKLRAVLIANRQAMPDAVRAHRTQALHQRVLAWLATRTEHTVGAYWPIRGEWDPIPTLLSWQAQEETSHPNPNPLRQIALPVIDAKTKTLRFHAWTAQTPLHPGAYGIPEPVNTPALNPQILLIPCVGLHPQGFRLGYGGGFYDRTLALCPAHSRPITIGVAFSNALTDAFLPEKHDLALNQVVLDELPMHALTSNPPGGEL